MISKKLAIEVLNQSLASGADYAEIFYENSWENNLTIENNIVDTVHTSLITGVGIRLLNGLQCVYGYTCDISKKSLLKLAKDLAKGFNEERKITIENLKVKKYKTICPIKIDYDDVPREEKIALLREGLDEIKDYDPRIIKTVAAFNDSHKNTIIYNSRGDIIKNSTQYGRVIFSVTASDGVNKESAFEGPGCQDDINYFKEKVNIRETARNAARVAIQNLEAKDCPSGMMPVVLGNGWGGVLFHEACGHPLEASAVGKKMSPFAGKTGQKIASDIVSAVDDSTIPNAWGSIDYDDEGVKGQKRQLIKNGVLTDYMIDEFNGRFMQAKPNGACRRQSFKFTPTSRMSNTYIENGKSSKEEVIQATKLGLYAVGFVGGSVNPINSEFNFSCSEAYIIRDGKICEPVKRATLIGKGSEILLNIDMVANDLDLGQGYCGASSGSIPTNVGQPTLRVATMTVGGKGGQIQ